jgi:hypothetical protein
LPAADSAKHDLPETHTLLTNTNNRRLVLRTAAFFESQRGGIFSRLAISYFLILVSRVINPKKGEVSCQARKLFCHLNETLTETTQPFTARESFDRPVKLAATKTDVENPRRIRKAKIVMN